MKQLDFPKAIAPIPDQTARRSRRSPIAQAEQEREHDESSAEELDIDEFDEEFDVDFEQDDTDMRQFEEELNTEQGVELEEDDVEEFEAEEDF
jgi:hypothetical protein